MTESSVNSLTTGSSSSSGGGGNENSKDASNILRIYSNARSFLFQKLRIQKISSLLFENSCCIHFLTLFTTILFIATLYAQLRSFTLFSLHPVCMTIAVICFFGEGIASTKNTMLLEFFSPIMEHSKRIKTRTIHQSLQLIGTAFFAAGLFFIACNKVRLGKTLIPSTYHASAGFVSAIIIGVQIYTGLQKIENLRRNNVKVLRWHGGLGLLGWDIMIFTVLSGIYQTFSYSLQSAAVAISVLLVYFAVHNLYQQASSVSTSSSTLSSKDIESKGSIIESVDRDRDTTSLLLHHDDDDQANRATI